MPRFDYVLAHSLKEACELLNEPGVTSRPLAGGSDLLVYIRKAKPSFERLVDISRIAELRTVAEEGGIVHLGAGVTFSEVVESSLLARHARCLVEACESIGSPQIRNAGTLGGNVANAAACADTLPALVCLDAVAHLRGPSGERTVRVTDFVRGPNQTMLLPGELLTHFHFAIPPHRARSTFIKLGRRNAQAISRLSMAALACTDADQRIDLLRLVPGAAVPRPQHFAEVESMLVGQPVSDALLSAAGERTAAAMIALAGRRWSTEYKEAAIKALAERALRQVLVNGGAGFTSEMRHV